MRERDAPDEAPEPHAAAAWAEACRLAACCAVEPAGLGGVRLRAPAGPVRDAWLRKLQCLLPAAAPWRRLPLQVADERLLGGLDLAATLASGRPVAQRGLLAEADGGIVVAAMAERLAPATAARLSAVLDRGAVEVAREGVASRQISRIGIVALDEGEGDEAVPAGLADRLAIWLDLTTVAPGDVVDGTDIQGRVVAARDRLAGVHIADDAVAALCLAALELGIGSMRAPLRAMHLARICAALDGRDEASRDDVAFAARWVLGPRARTLPATAEVPDAAETDAPKGDPGATPETAPTDPSAASDAAEPDPAESPAATSDPLERLSADADADANANADADERGTPGAGALADAVIEATRATLPLHLLASCRATCIDGSRSGRGGHAGAGSARDSLRRGAPLGSMRGPLRGGARLDLLATLRTAAPWQRLRRAPTHPDPTTRPRPDAPARIVVQADDFRIRRYRERRQTTVIFVVDASGSSALHRLDEAKGAVVLLLADCYARRDSVALLAFRGPGTELLLPPTRSLARARRCLGGLPGGGATPLAGALDAAGSLADVVRRHGDTPLAVLLTDGRANIARDGTPGRERAEADALTAARRLRASGLASTVIDTSPRAQPAALRLADQMGARYLPLASGGARALSQVVREAKAHAAAPARGTA